jgi:shikimate dehydrogenase
VISGATRVVVVIGDPIEHTRSPAIMNAAFAERGLDFAMVALRVAPDHLIDAVRGLGAAGVIGASVTTPHKSAVAALCDHLSPTAAAIGSVNCLAWRGGALHGDSTDGAGFVRSLGDAGVAVANANVVILGSGGAARAIETALAGANARTTVVARRPETATWMRDGQRQVVGWEMLDTAITIADVLVDATPTGLDATDEAAFVDGLPLDRLPGGAVVASLVYHRAPLLLDRAREAGHPTVDGKHMLVHQAAIQFETWTGVPASIDTMLAAF